MSITETLNQTKPAAFAEKMMGHLNGAALTLMVSVCHRAGLFDAMAELPPSSSKEIAEAAKLDERYVREALGALVTGDIVVFDPETNQYHLPAEHAAFLTRKNSPNNIAVTTQWISVLGSVEDRIVECFKNGGGVPYEAYHRFHEVMADESDQTVVAPLIESLIPLADGLREKLERGIEVLDAGCGSGYALAKMAKHFPNSRFTGYDLCEEAVLRARKRAQADGLANIVFETKDVAQVPHEEMFDLITTFDSVHDQADPARVLRNIYRALKKDGIYFMQDIAGSSHVHHDRNHPVGPFLYTISCMHCMSVSLSQNGAGLGAMWGKETACRMLKEAGFTRVEVKELEHDVINYYYLVRK